MRDCPGFGTTGFRGLKETTGTGAGAWPLTLVRVTLVRITLAMRSRMREIHVAFFLVMGNTSLIFSLKLVFS
jgi:hypothetical protein